MTTRAMPAFPIAKNLPLEVGILHFVGIGGIGMSGIAELLHNLGYQVRGSDLAESPNVVRLRRLGIPVDIGQRADHVDGAAVLVISSAVRADNPEVRAARERQIPIVRRAEMLAELLRLKISIAIAGSHGKTTVTSMLAMLLDTAGLDPTVINGGIINSYGTNTRLGGSDWMVVEADESDGTFTSIPATIAIVTNLDPEHLDHYGGYEALKSAFQQFLQQIPFYGFAVLCADHPEVQALIPRVQDRRLITYGFSPQADVRAVNVEQALDGSRFDMVYAARLGEEEQRIEGLHLPMPGRHNIQNALAALAVAHELKLDEKAVRRAFAQFEGVKRRFTHMGTGAGIAVIDDYAHHPVEIQATLAAARSCRQKGEKVIAVFQPHRYSRVRDLFKDFCRCFDQADIVLVADIYPAGEAPIEGIDAEALVKGIREFGHRHVVYLPTPEALAQQIHQIGQAGDMAVCLGAGNITNWAVALPEQLENLVAAGVTSLHSGTA